MFIVRLGARNLLRNLRRTLLSMGAVIAGVFVLVLGDGFIGGLDENIIRAQVDGLSGHVMVRPTGYPTEGMTSPVDELFGPAALGAWLDAEGLPWAPRVLFSPRAVKGADAMRVRAIGYDVERDPTVFPRDLWNIQGAYPQTAADGVLVSTGVARVLEVKAGDRMVFETRTADGAINALDLPVAGIFSAGNSALDQASVLFPMDLTEQLVIPHGEISHLAIRLPRRDDATAFAEQVRAHAPEGTDTVTWVDETEDMMAIQRIRRKALNLLVLVLMGMSATGIANTILMAAYERIREIGTLRAMGMNRADVVRLFLVEGALMGLIGGAVGAGIAGSLVWYWTSHGIDMSESVKDMGNIAIASMLYTSFSASVVAAAVAFGVVVAVLASIWPALVASRMSPADAVRAD